MKHHPEEASPRAVESKGELAGFSALEAMEALEDGFLMVDSSLRVSAANLAAEQLLGLSRAELLGRALDSLLGEQGSSRAVHEGCERVRTERQPVRIIEHRASAGQWLEFRLRPMREQVWLFIRDVTREQLAQKARMAAVDSIVAGLCHELNNPMTAIRMSVELLSRHGLDPQELRATLEVIDRQSRRCSSLLKTLLDFSRHPAVVREPCDVEVAAKRAVELAGPQLARRGVSVDQRLSGAGLPRVYIHGAELETALLNVVKNAVEASPAGATVIVKAQALTREGVQGVEVTVSDSGHGIPQNLLPHVIEPFFTTKPPGEGIGLGLAMTWRFLDSHGGRLKIDSAPGRGTTVRMWLPSVPVIGVPASTGPESIIQ